MSKYLLLFCCFFALPHCTKNDQKQKPSYFETEFAKKCEKQIEKSKMNGTLPNITQINFSDLKEKNYCKIVLCRHGKTQSNIDGLVQGNKIDDPLLKDQDAKEFKKFPFSFEKAYTSNLIRSTQTTKQIIGKNNNIIIIKELEDIDYGDYNCQKIKDVIVKKKFNEMYLNLNQSAPNGSDTYSKVIIRMHDTINKIAINNINKEILIVSSQYPLNLLCALIKGTFYPNLKNLTPIILYWIPGKNCTQHDFPTNKCPECSATQIFIKS